MFADRFWSVYWWARRWWSGLGSSATGYTAARQSGPLYGATRQSGPLYLATPSVIMDPTNIYLDNDHLIEWDITLPNTSTRVVEAAAGLSLTGYISTTLSGTAIGTSSVSLTEAAGKPGTYYGVIDRTAINTDLTTYENGHVFEIVKDSANLQFYRELLVTRREA